MTPISRTLIICACSSAALLGASLPISAQVKENSRPANGPVFHDSHFHLTNYVQEGTDIRKLLHLMGNTIGRSTLFGIPLQQQWAYRLTGNHAPTYYLDTDAQLYYYSFTDAYIAAVYKSLTPEQQDRFDPMITGFNPTDMYASDHIRRVLKTFPGVFTGIGEFTIHKEFVSSKVAGGVATLLDPALDRIFETAAEIGLVVLIHNDIATPFFKPTALVSNPSALEFAAPDSARPINFTQMKDFLRKHPQTTTIWAHMGLGRIIHPLTDHAGLIEAMLKDPAFNHVYFDISWDEVAKYIIASPAATQIAAGMINRNPDRFLFGTDVVAPGDTAKYYHTYKIYAPLWEQLTPETRDKVALKNYERLFNGARNRVRQWEKANVPAGTGQEKR